jgi:hypothetical protein
MKRMPRNFCRWVGTMILHVLNCAALFLCHMIGVLSMMETAQVKTQCMLWLAELKSVLVWMVFQWMYHRDPPTDKAFGECRKKFWVNGSVLPTQHTGQPGSSQVGIQFIWWSFACSLKKSMRQLTWALHVPKTAMHIILINGSICTCTKSS